MLNPKRIIQRILDGEQPPAEPTIIFKSPFDDEQDWRLIVVARNSSHQGYTNTRQYDVLLEGISSTAKEYLSGKCQEGLGEMQPDGKLLLGSIEGNPLILSDQMAYIDSKAREHDVRLPSQNDDYSSSIRKDVKRYERWAHLPYTPPQKSKPVSGGSWTDRILRKTDLTTHPEIGGLPLHCQDSDFKIIIRGYEDSKFFSKKRAYALFMTGPEDKLKTFGASRDSEAPQKDGTLLLAVIPGTDFSTDYVKLVAKDLDGEGICFPFLGVSKRIREDIEHPAQKPKPPARRLGMDQLPDR